MENKKQSQLDKEEEQEELKENNEEEIKEHRTLHKVGMFFLDLIKIIILAGITIGLVRYFLFKPFYVKGQSMEPAFYERDYLIIDEITYRFREPQRGEVVVFRAPSVKDDHYLKRIVGLPGERVKVEDNKVIIYNDEHPQGIVVEENYLEEDTPGSASITLGADEYFVLGDNRDSSYDSRRFGAINRDAFVGKVWLRGWPFARFGIIDKVKFNL